MPVGIGKPVERVGSGFEEGAAGGDVAEPAAGGIEVDAGSALHGARITPLVNLRRLDGDALAAMGTDERDHLVHAGSRGMGRSTVRTADRHPGGRRLEQALRGQLPYFVRE